MVLNGAIKMNMKRSKKNQMLKKIIISAIKYIISGGAIALKAKAIQQDIYKLDNFHTWDI